LAENYSDISGLIKKNCYFNGFCSPNGTEKAEPDWLLIYLLRGDDEVVFERTGRHTDLFD